MSALVEVPQNSPAEADLFEERSVDSRDPACSGIDQNYSLHAGEHIFHTRRWMVLGIGPELQPHQPVSDLAEARCALLLAVIFVQKGVGQSLHDAQRVVGALLLLRMLVPEFLWMGDESDQVGFFASHLFR